MWIATSLSLVLAVGLTLPIPGCWAALVQHRSLGLPAPEMYEAVGARRPHPLATTRPAATANEVLSPDDAAGRVAVARGSERAAGGGRVRWSSPLTVAQCRARCLQTFSGGPREDAVCMQGPDCFMCWENCELLQSDFAVWGAMCSQKDICFPGCQQACKFHREVETAEEGASRQPEPVVRTLGHQVVQVVMPEGTQGGGIPFPLVRWPPFNRPSRDTNGSVVYVLMTKKMGADSWTQVTQTVDLEARLLESPAVVAQLDIRVMVVDPEGLATIYRPAGILGGRSDSERGLPPPHPSSISTTISPSTSPFLAKEEAVKGERPLVIREDVTSPLDDAQLALLFPTAASAEQAAVAPPQEQEQQHQSAPSSPTGSVHVSSPWMLREVSLIHQRVLVIAEVSWEARMGARVYLVTWEVDGGGLKGNLFTHTTSVTLSLWPQTLYHIQVEVVSRIPGNTQPPDRSQVLHLDTRRAAPVVLAPDAHQQAPAPHSVRPNMGSRNGASPEVLAGVGVALLVFFIFSVALSQLAAWRRPCRPTGPLSPPLCDPEHEARGGDHGDV